MNVYFPDSVGFQTVAVVYIFLFLWAKLIPPVKTVASVTVLLFDFIITFDSEVRWTWGRGWGIIRIIFIVSRYLPFVSLVMTVYCIRWLGIAAAELLLVVRTYVVWGCDRRFLALTLTFTTVVSVAVLVISDVGTSEFGDSTGVFVEGQSSSIVYGLLIHRMIPRSADDADTVQTLQIFPIGRQPVGDYFMSGWHNFHTMYHSGLDGELHFRRFTTSILHRTSCWLSRRSPQLVAHSVLASRILFNLREMSDLQDVVTDDIILGVVSQPIAFETPPYTDQSCGTLQTASPMSTQSCFFIDNSMPL
ncbi:hypothetical protein EV424DRAFT_1349822 [Suillus variegatus]|nr:hypothetical protein EV424DRAFT_1349822 [Suillus variegatus]